MNNLTRRRWKRKDWAVNLLGGVCARCGTTERLEFDHIDPKTMSFRIGSGVWGRKLGDLQAELTKCQLLCNPCHLLKTLSERPHAQHGSLGMYTNHHCRCARCKEANRLYARRKRDHGAQ